MQKFKCKVCGHVFDPQKGDPTAEIEPGVDFADLPDNWTCPVCGAKKSKYRPLK